MRIIEVYLQRISLVCDLHSIVHLVQLDIYILTQARYGAATFIPISVDHHHHTTHSNPHLISSHFIQSDLSTR